MNPQYSNARYFLGLIYSRAKSTDAAIAQFEEIMKLNPDNQEVKKILDNLRMGKPALDGIAPPATPPEQRNQPPISENQQSATPAPTPQTAPARPVRKK
jgi:tetratricopeptide (TPR) repeat protein